MARNWREIRAEAVAQGRVDPARADAADARCCSSAASRGYSQSARQHASG